MDNTTSISNSAVATAFHNQEQRERVGNTKIGCVLVATLMPMGIPMDYFVYPKFFTLFLELRVASAVLATLILIILLTRLEPNTIRKISFVVPLVPVFFITWMIAKTEGFESPYYSGLNLVLLAVGAVLQWTVRESLFFVSLVLVIYLITGICHAGGFNVSPILANNLFFMISMDIIAVVGGYFQHKARFREFALRFELDKSKNELEATNTKLSAQNLALAKANQETRQAEMQLVQSEKLASLGRFSAGLMHDVLNPLNYAKTGTFTLRKKCRSLPTELKGEFENILTDVEDGLQRVDHIISDLRTFTHPGGQAAESTDIAEVLNMSLRFVSSELKDKKIQVETSVAPGQKAWISRNHMILVLVNLMENAIDALEEKKFADGESPAIRITGSTHEGRSHLKFHDNGPGIDAQHLSKVFDPFYTTKDVGKGTGLGLSICFGIMRGYSGDIRVASVPGKFCEFTVELPCSRENVTVTENAEPIRL